MTLPERRRTNSTIATDGETIRFLMADDDDHYRAFVLALARRLGFECTAAVDGADAVAKLAAGAFDVAVIDCEMPRMDGLDVIRRLREDEAAKSVYAVMLTGRPEMATKVAALDAGFDDFMSKTATDAELVAKLRAIHRVALRQRSLDHTIRDLYGIAMRDELTAVFNRRFFVAETDRMLVRGARISVILFDLDGFKHVNDTYGHLAGDQILRDLGAMFLRSTRPEDLVARYGGDEFVMVVSELGIAEIEALIKRLTETVAAMQWTAGVETFGIGITAGFASAGLLDPPTIYALLDAADRDLYKNKWIRRNPDARPELYEYPRHESGADVVLAVTVEREIEKVESVPASRTDARVQPRVP
jgi:diguanylate cyclase (GGDEF)-like protein